MGFFDAVVANPANAGTTAVATAPIAATAPVSTASADSGDFLMIDDVTVADVPDTVADPTVSIDESPIAFDAPNEAVLEIDVAEPTEGMVESDVVTFEPEVVESVISEVTPVEAPSEVSFLSSEMAEAAEMAAPESAISFEAAPEAEGAMPAASVMEPEAAILATISQLKTGVAAKESERDAEMAKNAEILADLAKKDEEFRALKAKMKELAAEAKRRAEAIDASANTGRAFISNLEAMLTKKAA